MTTVFIELPNTKIELLGALGDKSPIAAFLQRNPNGGIHHLCYEVPDISEARDRLVAARRARARPRRAKDRRPRQAGAVPSSQGFLRHAGRARAGLGHDARLRHRHLRRHLVDRAVRHAADRRAHLGGGGRGVARHAPKARRICRDLLPKMVATTVVASVDLRGALRDHRASRDHARPDSVLPALRDRALRRGLRGVAHQKKARPRRPCFCCNELLISRPARLAVNSDYRECWLESGCACNCISARLELLPPKTWTWSNLNA